MRFAWSLGHPEFAAVLDRRVEAVLIEYDGPQLVVLRDSRKQWFLGLAADHDADGERWIHAQVTPMELEALCTNGVTMRNAVCKSSVDLVDYVGGKARNLWRTTPDDVPSGILPQRGAYLPFDIGRRAISILKIKRKPQKQPVFRCGGRVVHENNITFTGLSAVTSSLQVVWAAISNFIFPKMSTPEEMSARLTDTTLCMGVGVHGSFGIGVVVSNSDAFIKIASQYRKLLAMPPDGDPGALSLLPRELIVAHSSYLRALDQNGIEVLANWSDEAAFVGYEYARQARVAISPNVATIPALPESPAPPDIVSLRGFFELFGLNKKHFEFYDVQTGQTVSGRIDPSLARRVRDADEVRVGHQTQYDVQVDHASQPPTLKHLYPVQTKLFKS